VRRGNGNVQARDYDTEMGLNACCVLVICGCSRFGIDASRALMTGDRLDTDVLFGHRAGMSTMLVYVISVHGKFSASI